MDISLNRLTGKQVLVHSSNHEAEFELSLGSARSLVLLGCSWKLPVSAHER